MPEVRLVNIVKRFGNITALRGINLTVEDGEYVCILGPSGCGKTTLLRIIAGLLKPDEGQVYIDGEDVTHKPPEYRGIGFVFQSIALFPHMNSWENVLYGPIVKGLDKSISHRIAREIMRTLKTIDYSGLYPGELSGGIAQMIAIARALATGAKLLLLDEPLGALDPRIRVDLRYELRRIVKGLGLTAIHVTHNQEEALTIADRIVVMRSGMVEAYDTPENLYWYPKNLFVADFIGKVNVLEGFIKKALTGGKALVELTGGISVEVYAKGFSEGDKVVVAVRPENFEILDDSEADKANLLRGVVTRARFMGDYYRYDVTLESGECVTVNTPLYRSEKNQVRKKGEPVLVRFDPEKALVYAYPKRGIERELSIEV